jgi:hypothetical protein
VAAGGEEGTEAFGGLWDRVGRGDADDVEARGARIGDERRPGFGGRLRAFALLQAFPA